MSRSMGSESELVPSRRGSVGKSAKSSRQGTPRKGGDERGRLQEKIQAAHAAVKRAREDVDAEKAEEELSQARLDAFKSVLDVRDRNMEDLKGFLTDMSENFVSLILPSLNEFVAARLNTPAASSLAAIKVDEQPETPVALAGWLVVFFLQRLSYSLVFDDVEYKTDAQRNKVWRASMRVFQNTAATSEMKAWLSEEDKAKPFVRDAVDVLVRSRAAAFAKFVHVIPPPAQWPVTLPLGSDAEGTAAEGAEFQVSGKADEVHQLVHNVFEDFKSIASHALRAVPDSTLHSERRLSRRRHTTDTVNGEEVDVGKKPHKAPRRRHKPGQEGDRALRLYHSWRETNRRREEQTELHLREKEFEEMNVSQWRTNPNSRELNRRCHAAWLKMRSS